MLYEGRAAEESRTGLDCIVASGAQKEPDAGKHEFTCGRGLWALKPEGSRL